MKLYSCRLCGTSPDQISHHLAHLHTQKHTDKYKLYFLFLSHLPSRQLLHLFNTSDIKTILSEFETSLYSPSQTQKLNFDFFCSSFKSSMLQYHTSISNKEALKDKIHEIHNYMRNHGIGYGMNALKTFNVLYGLKKIEDSGLIDLCRLQRPYCEFSYMVKLANEGKHEELTECIIRHALDSLSKSPLQNLLFYEIEGNVRASVFSWLVQEIDKIGLIEKTCNVLLSGKIYEYFIGRDETAISELGAYFTDRHIVDFIVDRIQPTIREDETVYPMIDMFGGSGGFTTGYVQYLLQKYPERIDWKTEIKKIYHYDMNDDVVKYARLELFCLTGAIPNDFNLSFRSSFADEFGHRKFHYILTNPPYGGDKQDTTEATLKRQKIMEYIKHELTTLEDDTIRVRRQRQFKALEEQEKNYKKQQDKLRVNRRTCSGRINSFIVKNKITNANDKESCSLILMMDLLEIGGTAAGVLKEGVFFNKTYKDIRRVLVEKFNVREIISVPSDQFENTSTKTSIVIFDNTEKKTSTVKFSDLVVERYSDDRFEEIGGDVYLVENKGDIQGVSASLVCEATREQILAHEMCSLNPKEYLKKEIVVGKEYELKRLGDVTDIKMGSTPDTKQWKFWENGTIPWITVSELNNERIYDTNKCLTQEGAEKMANRKIPKDSILLSFKLSIGKLGIAGRDNMFCNEAIVYLNSKLPHIPQMYLYYVLEMLDLEQYGRGTIGKHGNLNKEILQKVLIPVPKSPTKIQEWTDKISEPYNEVQTKRQRVKELDKQVQDRVREITDNEECESVKFGDVVNFIKGKKRNTTDGNKTGVYPLFSSSLTVDHWIDTYDYDKKCIIMNTINGTGHFKMQLGTKFCATSNTLIFKCNDDNVTLYVFYYGKIHANAINYLSNGSTKKKLGKSDLQKFTIKIPKNKQLIQDLEPTFQEIENLQHDIHLAEKRYKQYIQELSQEAMPSSS